MKKRHHGEFWVPLLLIGASLGILALLRHSSEAMAPKPGESPGQAGSSRGGADSSRNASAAAPGGQPEKPSGVPKDWQDGGIFSDSYERAYELLSAMTPEQRAAQLFLARCPRTGQEELIRQYQPGGFVLFGEDFSGKSKEQVVAEIAAYQAASPIAMLIAVDEEGGSVVRISSNPQLAPARFASPQELYNAGGLDSIRENAAVKNALLRELGLNLNLAPVADVSSDPADYIYKRTLGRDAEETADYVAFAVQANREDGVASALKHFPGYGNNRNTHTGSSIDERSLESFRSADLLPFRAGIRAGAETVLVSHNIVKCMDPEMPASLSEPVHRLLREELGFTGLIMTDDLYMDAIRVCVKGQDPAVSAVLAGNDLIVTTDFAQQLAAVLWAVKEGTIPQETIDHAAFRVLAMKLHTGILSSAREE